VIGETSARDAWRERAGQALAQGGAYRTAARSRVLDVVAAADCCRSAHEIHQTMRDAGNPVGIATVYRVLDLLERLRLLRRLEINGTARYEAADDTPHHHIVCRACGRVLPYRSPALDAALGGAARLAPFHVTAGEVLLYGTCPDCDPPA